MKHTFPIWELIKVDSILIKIYFSIINSMAFGCILFNCYSTYDNKAYEFWILTLLLQKASLEGTLCDTQNRYSNMMGDYQNKVLGLEGQLAQLRSDLERQGHEYQVLLDTKTRLEMEISEYRRLLDGEVFRWMHRNLCEKNCSSFKLWLFTKKKGLTIFFIFIKQIN